jgi:hypothetical protein
MHAGKVGFALPGGACLQLANRHCAEMAAVTAKIGKIREAMPRLDSVRRETYLLPIPIHRLPGGAFVRASVFRLGSGFSSDEMGQSAAPWS